MTYCLAIKVNQGLVFASDSRTNAGVDYVSTYSKMHVFGTPGDRLIVLINSGNLATTQAVLNAIQRDLEDPSAKVNLNSFSYLFDAAQYVGHLSQRVQSSSGALMKENGTSIEARFILGGQIHGRDPNIYLIYPEGNYITASLETPYLQIGETKYGKPILDRIIRPETSLEDAARCALVSIDSTMRANISVGPPVELAIYQRDSLSLERRLSFDYGTPFFSGMQKSWNKGLRRAFDQLPRFDWESPKT
ncbi:MAG: proteasome-type protease [Gammaproteobacteria bacterium]|nr:proteasome-type protease [Gammaproteobacteria bacterium]MDH5511924.1 proteasome-type protease [Gammaproteobacteria bacterium]